MRATGRIIALVVLVSALVASGCAAPKVDFSTIQRPDRAPELDAFDVFVGSWTWNAKMLNAEGEDEAWTGTAEWSWTLDKRCLHGVMSVHGANLDFKSAGVWSWHPKSKKYIWWMFNNWGYPQEGTAKYYAEKKCWCMSYTSVGLDGTTSYGRYCMKVADQDTLKWCVTEWADALHMFKKMEMEGTYKRKK